jgi:choline monooxygenase
VRLRAEIGIHPATWVAAGSAERLRDRALARTWHCLGEVGALSQPGAWSPRVLLPGALDEPVIVTHGPSGLRAFANVCTHRLALLATEPGSGRALSCPYHGRTFDLDGRCRGQRGFSGVVDGFPDEGDHLRSIPLAVWGGLLFASLDPELPFAELVGPVADMLPPFDVAQARVEPGPVYDLRTTFLAWAENYLEGLHVPFVHPGLGAVLETDRYGVRALPNGCSVQAGVVGPGEPALPDHPAWPGDRLGGLYATVFPTTMLNFYPWGISMNLIEPLGVDRCRILYRYYVTDPALRAIGAGGDLDTVEAEDQAVVDRVGRGMRSRFAGPSRFAPGHEDAVAGYHAELARLLGL